MQERTTLAGTYKEIGIFLRETIVKFLKMFIYTLHMHHYHHYIYSSLILMEVVFTPTVQARILRLRDFLLNGTA